MFQCAWYEVCTDNSDIISGHILKEIIILAREPALGTQ